MILPLPLREAQGWRQDDSARLRTGIVGESAIRELCIGLPQRSHHRHYAIRATSKLEFTSLRAEFSGD